MKNRSHSAYTLSMCLRILFVSFLLLDSTSCASSQPESVAKSFIRAIVSGDASKALDSVCLEGVSLIVAVEMDWSDDYYEVLSNDGQAAQILVTGRTQITVENLERFAQEMEIALPRTEVGLQVGINFDGLYMKYDEQRKQWCLEDRSITALQDYLISLFEDSLSH